MPFAPRLAFEPLPVQEAYALNALQQLLPYLAASSPFYKALFLTSHVDMAAVKTLANLQLLPFTTKEDMQAQNWDFLCVPKSSIREYTATSGTMGWPVTIALTEGDLQRLAYNESQAFRCVGGGPEDIYQLALTLDRQFMAGAAYYAGIRALGAASVRTGPGLPQLQWETAQRLGTTALVAVPSFLVAMTGWAAEAGVDLKNGPVKSAVCIGESIRRADFSLNTLGEKLAAKWPIRLHSTYAATELQTAFTECSAGMGGHHQPDLIIVEIIDDAGNPLSDGVPGEVVITTLGIEAMPLLRYRTGDVAALHAEPCICGRLSKRLGPIIGRRGQMIKYRGTTLYPPAIIDILSELPAITASLVEAYTGALGTDELRLHLHSSIAPEDCEAALRPLLQSRLRVAPSMAFHSAESLQAMQLPAGARKPLRFLDNRNR